MAKFDITAIFKIEGVDKVQKAFADVNKSAEQLGKSYTNFTKSVGESAKRIALITAAATAASAGILKLVKANDDLAESVQNTAKQTGIAVQSLQEMQQAAEFTGINPDALNKGLVRLTKNLGDLSNPAGTANKSIAELDSTLASNLSRANSTEEAYDILRKSLSKMNDESKVAEIAQIAFGKAGLDLIPVLTQTSEEYDKQIELIRRYGVTLNAEQLAISDQVGTAFDRANLAISGTAKLLGVALTPAVEAALNAFAELVIANRQGLVNLVTFISTKAAKAIRDFYFLITKGPEVEGVGEKTREIYKGFLTLKNVIVSTFKTVATVLRAVNIVLDPFAKLLGLESGRDLAITIAVLQFTGILKVFTSGIILAKDAVGFFFTAMKVGPAIVADLAKTFAVLGPQTVSLFETLYLSFLYSMDKIAIAANVMATTVLPRLALAFRSVWLAITGPVGLAIAAFALVSAAIYKLVDETIGWGTVIESVTGFLQNLGVVALEIITNIGDFFIGLGVIIADVFNQMLTFVKEEIIPGVLSAFEGAFESVMDFFLGVVERIKNALSPIWEFIRNGFVTAFGGLADLIAPAVDAIKGIFTGFYEWIKSGIVNAFVFVWDTIKNTIIRIVESITNTVKTIVENIKSLFGGLRDAVANVTQRGREARTGVTSSGSGQTVTFAGGGKVTGPGSGTSDSILARISNGEFVVRADAVKKFGVGFLNMINNGVMPNLRGFANGGFVDTLNSFVPPEFGAMTPAFAEAPVNGGGNSGRALNLYLPNGERFEARTSDDTARKLQKSLRKSASLKSTPLPRWNK